MTRTVSLPMLAVFVLSARPTLAVETREVSSAMGEPRHASKESSSSEQEEQQEVGESASTTSSFKHKLRGSASAMTPSPVNVVVVGKRRPDLGTTVTVQRHQQLERLGATNVAEALDRSSSATVSRNERGESVLSLRGFGQRQVLVLMDGIPAAVPYDGRLDLAKIPVDLVQRVVVVKGAGSLLYGPNGLGGVVNIVTRRPGTGPSWTLRTEVEPVRSVSQSMTASGAGEGFGYLVGVSLGERLSYPLASSFPKTPNEDGAERESSDARLVQGLGKFTWDISTKHRVQALLSGVRGRYGVPPGAFDLTPRYWRWSDWGASSMSLAHRWTSGRSRTTEAVYLSLSGNTLDSFDDSSYSSQRSSRAFTSTYRDLSAGGYIRGKTRLTSGTWFGALDLLGWASGQHDVHRAEGMGPKAVEASSNILTVATQLQWRPASSWLLVPGVQGDVQVPDRGPDGSTPDVAWALGPMVSVARALGERLWLSSTVAMRSRFPTLRERYSEVFGSRAPNPELEAERAVNGSVDLTWRLVRHTRLTVGAFASEVSNLVVLVPVGGGVEQLQNVGEASFRGVELEGRARLGEVGEVFGGWTWLSAARNQPSQDEPGVPYRPEHKGLVGVVVRPWAWLEATVAERLTGPQWFQNPNTLRWGKLGWSERLDARVEVTAYRRLRLWVRGANLLDSNVWSRYGYPEPGRQVFFGVKVAGAR